MSSVHQGPYDAPVASLCSRRCGAWQCVGPLVSPVLLAGVATRRAGSTHRRARSRGREGWGYGCEASLAGRKISYSALKGTNIRIGGTLVAKGHINRFNPLQVDVRSKGRR